MKFNDYDHKCNLRNKATSKIKLHQVLFLGIDNDDIYLRSGPYSSDIGFINLHLSKETHWVAYINENLFDSCGISPPKRLSNFLKK